MLGLSPLPPPPKKLVGYCLSTGNAGKLFWGKHESGNLAITISKIPVEHHQYHHVDLCSGGERIFAPFSLSCVFSKGEGVLLLFYFTLPQNLPPL